VSIAELDFAATRLEAAQGAARGGDAAIAILDRSARLLEGDPARRARLVALAARLPGAPPDAAGRLEGLLHPDVWRVRRRTLDLDRAGRPRLFLYGSASTWLGLERLVEALLERSVVLYGVDSASAPLVLALRQLWMEAGLPEGRIELTPLPLDRAAECAIAARPAQWWIEGEPALVNSADAAAVLPRARLLHPSLDAETQLPWLRETVRHAATLPLYRDRFAAAGLEGGRLESWTQFRSLPLTQRDDLLKLGPPASDALLAAPFASLEGAYLYATGGTTGASKYAVYGFDEWDEITDIAAMQLVLDGIGRGDRVGNVFYPGKLWSAFIAIDIALRKIGSVSLPFGHLDAPEVLARVREFGVSALIGIPSVLMRLAQVADASGSRPRIARLIYAGEHMTEGMANYLQEVFSTDEIRSVAYSAIDAGVIGFQPTGGERGVYHALENHAVVEICDPETGREVAVGEQGEVVVTNHARRLFPVVRLRTGDVAVRLDGGRFRLRGRNDDKLRVGGGNIYLSDMTEVCRRLEGEVGPQFQVRLGKEGGADRVTLLVEARRPLGEGARRDLAARVRDLHLTVSPHLRQMIGEGHLRHYDIEVAEPGGLPLDARTGKLRRVIDARLDESAPAAPVHIEQSLCYAGAKGGQAWLKVVSDPGYHAAGEQIPLAGVAAAIRERTGGCDLEVVGLGPADGRKEVALALELRSRGHHVPLMRLVEISPPLVDLARSHAEARLNGGTRVRAEQGDLRHVGRKLAGWGREEGAARVRLFTMFGGTFSNLDDELVFLREGLGGAKAGDLLLLDLSVASAPVDRLEEVLKRDPRLSEMGQTGLRPGELAWLQGALADFVGAEGLDVSRAQARVRLNTACCPIPRSYAVEVLAHVPVPEGGERAYSLIYIKRYEPDALAGALRAAGWDEVHRESIGRGVVAVFQRA
jgi:phenylacetate-CoA ligase